MTFDRDMLERNVALLLSGAYRPAVPDPRFRRDLRRKVLAAAAAHGSRRLRLGSRGLIMAAAIFVLLAVGVVWWGPRWIGPAPEMELAGPSPTLETILARDGVAIRRADSRSWSHVPVEARRDGIDIETQTFELATSTKSPARLRLPGEASELVLLPGSRLSVETTGPSVSARLDSGRLVAVIDDGQATSGGGLVLASVAGDILATAGRIDVELVHPPEAKRELGAHDADVQIQSGMLVARVVLGENAHAVIDATEFHGGSTVYLQSAVVLWASPSADADADAADPARRAEPVSSRLAATEDTIADGVPDGASSRAADSGDDAAPGIATGVQALSGLVLDEATSIALDEFDVVLLERASYRDVVEPLTRAYRSPDGSFLWEGIDAGEYDVFIFADGHAVWRRDHVEIGRGTVEIEARLERGVTVRGRVIDAETGEPITRAVVFSETDAPLRYAFPLPSLLPRRHLRKAVTDDDGGFEIEHLREGVQVLRASHRRFAPGWSGRLVLAVGGVGVAPEIRLTRGGAVEGRVTDGSGEPRESATVIAVLVDRRPSSEVSTLSMGRTDDSGTYRIESLPAGQYVIVLGASIGTQSDQVVPLTVANDRTHIVDFLGKSEETLLSGRLLGADGELVMEPLEVSLERVESAAVSNEWEWTAAARAVDGRFEFRDVEPGRYVIYVGRRMEIGLSRQAVVEVAAATHVSVDVQLGASQVSGRVTDAATGQALSGTALLLEAIDAAYEQGRFVGRVMAEKGGSYSFEFVEPGLYRVLAIPPRRDLGVALAEAVSLPPSFHRTDIDIEIGPGGVLRVIARGHEGTPIEGVAIRLTDDAGREVRHDCHLAPTDGDAVTLRQIRPGLYDVEISAPGYVTARREIRIDARDRVDIALDLTQILPPDQGGNR